jgi:hypothetical protein
MEKMRIKDCGLYSAISLIASIVTRTAGIGPAITAMLQRWVRLRLLSRGGRG